MSNATKLSKNIMNLVMTTAFKNLNTTIFMQNQTFSEMLAYNKASTKKLSFSLVRNYSDFSSLSALDILVL
jgi:hypothetical protein